MVKVKKKSRESLQELQTDLAASIRKKQFRPADWIAERIIKSVAFLSITFVVLIFVFVFRETLPMFHTVAKGESSIQSESEESRPESYTTSPDLQPESYSPDAPEETELKPEAYSPDSEESDELKPEAYSPDAETEAVVTALPVDESKGSSGVSPRVAAENRHAIGTFLSKDWQPVSDNPRFGILPLFFGTLKVTLIAILFAAPIAILAALYTALLAPARIREYIKPAIELLAGFPSVVIGFFALMVLASFFQNLFGYSGRLNGFVGGVAMALAAIPVIYTLTEDALSAVPRTYIEASLGLGASLRQTAFQVILPAATPGIFAAVLLGVGRVFGETMIALMATGNAALMTLNPFDSVRTLSATIGAEMAEVVFGDTHYSVLFLIGSLLFIFTFTLNAVAEFYFRNRIIRRVQGK
jgi:phosphate transport system permease protein